MLNYTTVVKSVVVLIPPNYRKVTFTPEQITVNRMKIEPANLQYSFDDYHKWVASAMSYSALYGAWKLEFLPIMNLLFLAPPGARSNPHVLTNLYTTANTRTLTNTNTRTVTTLAKAFTPFSVLSRGRVLALCWERLRLPAKPRARAGKARL